MKVRAIVVFSLVLFAPLTAEAQDLTVDELVALALDRAPALRAVRTEVDSARGQLGEAGLRRNPMVASSRQEMIDGPDTQTMVEVEWPLDLYRRSARLSTARQAVEVSTLSVADRERLAGAAVREQAGRVLEARQSLRLLDEVLVTIRLMRDLIEARVKEGVAPRLELDILRVELQRVEAQRATQSALVETALIELKALAGLPPDDGTMLRGDLESEVRRAARERNIGSDIDIRADVREAVARVRLAETRLEEVQRDARIDASIFGEYARMSTGFPQRAFAEDGTLVPVHGLFNNVRVGVRVAVPIWDRNQGAIASATAERQRARYEVEASRLAAGAEAAVADRRARAAERVVEMYASGVREQARRNLDVVRETYQLGGRTLVEFLAEQRRYLDIETAYTQALAEAYQASVALRRAEGR